MNTLKDIYNPEIIDSHICLFDTYNELNASHLQHCSKCIGFADVEEKYSHYSELYDKYINNHKNINGYLLATGNDPDDIIHIYENHSDIIKGVGELKCYKLAHHEDNKPFVYKMDICCVEDIFKYCNLHRLPVLIHWDLIEDSYIFLESFLSIYKNIVFIHSHCGVPDPSRFQSDDILKESFKKSISLSKKYDNYYYDVTWSAIYLLKKYRELKSLINNKVLLGTDINPYMIRKDNIEEIELYKNDFMQLYKDFGYYNRKNVRKIYYI